MIGGTIHNICINVVVSWYDVGVRKHSDVWLRCVDLGMSWCSVTDVMEAGGESALDRRVCLRCGGTYHRHYNEQTLYISCRSLFALRIDLSWRK